MKESVRVKLMGFFHSFFEVGMPLQFSQFLQESPCINLFHRKIKEPKNINRLQAEKIGAKKTLQKS